MKPIRHVVTFAVDYEHLKRPLPSPSGPVLPVEPVDFCVIKRSSIAIYTMQERLTYLKVSAFSPSLLPTNHLRSNKRPGNSTTPGRHPSSPDWPLAVHRGQGNLQHG
jgi:hypothetical protein